MSQYTVICADYYIYNKICICNKWKTRPMMYAKSQSTQLEKHVLFPFLLFNPTITFIYIILCVTSLALVYTTVAGNHCHFFT
jgi:hypothetical protein